MFLTVKLNRVVVPDERHIFLEWNAVDNVAKKMDFWGKTNLGLHFSPAACV